MYTYVCMTKTGKLSIETRGCFPRCYYVSQCQQTASFTTYSSQKDGKLMHCCKDSILGDVPLSYTLYHPQKTVQIQGRLMLIGHKSR